MNFPRKSGYPVKFHLEVMYKLFGMSINSGEGQVEIYCGAAPYQQLEALTHSGVMNRLAYPSQIRHFNRLIRHLNKGIV